MQAVKRNQNIRTYIGSGRFYVKLKMSVSKERDRISRDDRSYERRDEDPKFVKSRIIVNNLDDKISRESVEEKFNLYGKVLGVSQHRTFTYVQFENEAAALTAVKDAHCSTFRGRKLDVHLVRDSKSDEKPRFTNLQRNSSVASKSRDYSRDSYSWSSYRDRSPSRGERENDDPYSRDGNSASRSFRTDDKNKDTGSGPRKNECSRHFSRNNYKPPAALPYKSRDVTENVERERSPSSNDCEIIVCNPALSDYAEALERRLKYMGMKVDLLFPTEKSPILQILEDISSRQCLYALVVTSMNEVHQSITVNILYGTPQEHRNMPLDDAMVLIKRNFDTYKRDMAAKFASRVNVASAVAQPREILASSVPQSSTNSVGAVGSAPPIAANLNDIQLLFRLLATGKPLTLTELDRVILHLQDSRNRLLASHSNATANVAPLQDNMIQRLDKPQTSIYQERILGLMTNQPVKSQTVQPDITYAKRPDPVSDKWGSVGRASATNDNGQTAISPTSNSSFINFDNPSIKKALDSLIQSGPSLLRSISVGAVAGGSSTEALQGGGGPYSDPKPYSSQPAYPPANAVVNLQSRMPSSDPYYYQRQFYN